MQQKKNPSDKGLTLRTSALESLYGGKFTLLSAQLIELCCLVITPPPLTQHHRVVSNLLPFSVRA